MDNIVEIIRNECEKPCSKCEKNNVDCFTVYFDPKFALTE